MLKKQHKNMTFHHMRFFSSCLILIGLIICSLGLHPAYAENPVDLSLHVFRKGARTQSPDQTPRLVAVLQLAPHKGWHAYGPGDLSTGQPTQVTFTLEPDGPSLSSLYPKPKFAPDTFDKATIVPIYDETTPIFAILPAEITPPFTVSAKVSMLLCSDKSCWPVHKTLDLNVKADTVVQNVSETPFSPILASLKTAAPSSTQTSDSSSPSETSSETFGETPSASSLKITDTVAGDTFSPRYATPDFEVSSVLKALPLAFLAGLLLNLMPCVLPVMSLKLTGLLAACSRSSAQERTCVLRQHNVMFSLGIVVYFIILSIVFGFLGLAWGQLFQSQFVIIVATAVVFLLSLSLFDIYHLPIMSLNFTKNDETSPYGAFLTGILATLLATPCSGPFLGGVLAWTLMQPVVVIMAVFVTIGFGMAFPYVLLAIRPEAMRFFPNPGPWMLHLERLVGFILVATSLYFLSMLETRLIFPTLILLWLVAAAAYIWGKMTNLSQTSFKRRAIRFVAVFIVVFGGFMLYGGKDEPTRWVEYTPESFNEAVCNTNLVLDFTADWCPTCKLLEKTVFTPTQLNAWSDQFDTTFMRVDLTRNNPQTMNLLNALGSQSIPLVALFPQNENCRTPVVIRDMFTSGQIQSLMKSTF